MTQFYCHPPSQLEYDPFCAEAKADLANCGISHLKNPKKFTDDSSTYYFCYFHKDDFGRGPGPTLAHQSTSFFTTQLGWDIVVEVRVVLQSKEPEALQMRSNFVVTKFRAIGSGNAPLQAIYFWQTSTRGRISLENDKKQPFLTQTI